MTRKILFFSLFIMIMVSCNSGNTNSNSNQEIQSELERDSLLLVSQTDTPDEQSDRDDNIITALEQLNIKPEDCNMEYITEKILPYDTDKSAIVIPKISHVEEEDFFTMDAYILVFDHKEKKIVHQFYEKDAWTSDAMKFTGITIDTAPYKLNSSTRAFAVKVSYSGSSRVNPYSETLISLFIPQGKKLVKVMDGYPISTFHGDFGASCEGGTSQDVATIFIMSEQSTNGYKDIITKSTITYTTYDEDCEESESMEYETDTIRYQEGKYLFERRGY